MDWITDQIAIGGYQDAQDPDVLQEKAINSILGLTRTLQGANPAILGVKVVEVVLLEDGPGNEVRLFLQTVDTLSRLVQEAPPVLVHCHAGRSRSVVVVAGYLMKTLGIGADEALDRVAARREVAVAPGLERLLDFIA
jgi:hypothetical protein